MPSSGMMQSTGMPNGISGIGLGADKVPELSTMCMHQPAVNNSPRPIDLEAMNGLYAGAMSYW